MLQEGKKAPDFNLPDSKGKNVSLKDFMGSKVVVYFYPADMTETCTKEACEFRNAFPDFKKIKSTVIGISPDSPASHKKFADKYNLPFILLSDEKKEILKKYGVWKEKIMFGNKYMGVERTTFILDEKGRILKIFPKVRIKGHVESVLNVLRDE